MPNKNPSFRFNRTTLTEEYSTPTKCGDQWGIWIEHSFRNPQTGDVVIVKSKGGKSWLAKLTEQYNGRKWLTEPYTGQMEIIMENGFEYDYYPVHSSNFFAMKAKLGIHTWYTADCMV